MKFSRPAAAVLLAVSLSSVQAQTADQAKPTGDEIVQQCDLNTHIGKDSRSTLTMILKDAAGNEQKNVYKRYWIDNEGRDQIVDKMMLFTEFPPDAVGTAFMRWGYVPGSDKNAEQWLYLPSLKTLRRVSVRDPGDSFLGSDLTYQDISYRALDADTHKLLREDKINGQDFYVVESTPHEKKPLYGKTVAWYEKTPDWAECRKRRVEYYDTHGVLIKTETLKWQKIGDAWLWDEVYVENVRTGHSSLFRITSPEVNVGLDDKLFSERTMRRGVR
jgi:hypothetical protein